MSRHIPEELRLKKIELNRAETRVHNFIEFIASGRASLSLADALTQAEQQVKSLSADVHGTTLSLSRPAHGLPTASASSTTCSPSGPRNRLSRFGG